MRKRTEHRWYVVCYTLEHRKEIKERSSAVGNVQQVKLLIGWALRLLETTVNAPYRVQ
jgi:hypothetical protein